MPSVSYSEKLTDRGMFIYSLCSGMTAFLLIVATSRENPQAAPLLWILRDISGSVLETVIYGDVASLGCTEWFYYEPFKLIYGHRGQTKPPEHLQLPS